ncbi:esterase/lipase family protein [Actinoallomurus sp. CA-150999]|uniref:esterase/lipase family protein n=1 Tax=Actinoallomurus sp. CA-150999 TaxID=3239887 RepID=UPI003D906A36
MRGLTATVAVGAVLAGTQGIASAATPPRSNSKNEAVYFIHGVDAMHTDVNGGGDDCKGTWNTAMSALRKRGWTGDFVTWGFYKKDTNCTRKYDGNLNTRIQELGRLLAWDIYDHYTKKGKSVDVVGHSMGGLIVRAAITGVNRYGATSSKWPKRLYIEDVATLSTPFTGTSWATTCTVAYGWKQCSDMRPGSGFLKWSGQNPQSAQGTDWTLIGASDDDTITSGAATGMDAKHKVIYAAHQGLEHSALPHKGPGTGWTMRYSNDNGKTWKSTTKGAGPIRRVGDALYYWSAA